MKRSLARALVLGTALALLGSSLAIAGKPAAAPAVSDEAKIRETRVLIPAGDHQVPGIFAVPRAGGHHGTYPAVLLLHGFASQKDEVGDMYKRLARELARRGYASLRIDFAGSGDSQQKYLDLTYPGMVADARAALDWLIARRETIDSRIGVQGFSLGSMVGATLVGSDTRVKAFASWSGAIYNGGFYGPEMLAACQANGGPLVLDLGFTKIDLSCAFFSTLAAETALDDIAPYANPLLLVAGSIDTTVNPQVSRNVVPVVHSLDVTLRIIPGADHIYLVLGPDQALANECIRLTARWFAEKL